LVAVVPQLKAKTILPDTCGDYNVKFDVKTHKNPHQTIEAEPGKAKIVFVENENGAIGLFMYATTRFGVDGAWVGANYDNSYFVVTLEPGVHPLCGDWQSSLKLFNKLLDVSTFTAEAEKVYYYAANVVVTRTATGQSGAAVNYDFSFAPLDEDQGKYRVKAWKLSTLKTK